ncbi:RidA family protein [Roseivirga sp.]|uniref:RidA family protein n=1 Tax=Roseivirga sp. TaxID=1964215 RepID=UPI003B530465
MNIEDKLAERGLSLPDVSVPGGNYDSINIRGHVGYIAIQFPIQSGEYLFTGRLGNEVTTEEGYQAMQLCALNVLAQINKKIGIEKLLGINHIDAYYQSAEDWDDAPHVVNGASDLFVNVLGEKGRHSRSIVGIHKLPRNFSVGLTVNCTLKTSE